MLGAASFILLAEVFVAPAGMAPLETAVQACTSWIAEPASWSGSVEDFEETTGLDKSGLKSIAGIPSFALPPPQARRNMHHFHVGDVAEGYFVTASDTVPVCHIVGGGDSDLFGSVQRFLQEDGYSRLWSRQSEKARGDIKTRTFEFEADEKIQLHLSHAAEAGGRTDRPQIFATIVYQLD